MNINEEKILTDKVYIYIKNVELDLKNIEGLDFKQLNSLYEQGDYRRGIVVADMYLFGVGVEKDEKKAFAIFEEISNKSEDKTILGAVQLMMACMYRLGLGVEADNKNFLIWMIKAYNNGEGISSYLYSYIVKMGMYGVQKNERLAFILYIAPLVRFVNNFPKPEDSCFPESHVLINEVFEFDKQEINNEVKDLLNKGFELYKQNDMTGALEEWNKANEKQSLEATYLLSLCYFYELGVEKDDKKCFDLLLKSVNGNLQKKLKSNAQYLLTHCYCNGIGVEKSNDKRIQLLTSMAEDGNKYAQYWLGYKYLFDTKESNGFELAEKFLKEASKNGCTRATTILGLMYTTSADLMVLEDEIEILNQKYKGVDLLEQASEKGDTAATKLLEDYLKYVEGYVKNKEENK